MNRKLDVTFNNSMFRFSNIIFAGKYELKDCPKTQVEVSWMKLLKPCKYMFNKKVC